MKPPNLQFTDDEVHGAQDLDIGHLLAGVKAVAFA